MSVSDTQLVAAAMEARNRAYTPYSHFAVGAALLDEDGTVWQGCNIENAAYSPGNCAERTAIFKAISEGARRFTAIAVAGGPAGQEVSEYTTPCGVCRQVLREFCDVKDFRILVAKSYTEYKTYTLGELLLDGFGPENLL